MLRKLDSLFFAFMVGALLLPLFSSCEERVPENMIEIKGTEAESFTFGITYKGTYLFLPVSSAELAKSSPAECLEKDGLLGKGAREYKWRNGKTFDDERGKSVVMNVAAGTKYTILAAPYDEAAARVTGEIQKVELETKPVSSGEGKVKIEIKEIKSTEVTYKTTPSHEIASYIVYINEESWFYNIMQNYEELGQGQYESGEALIEHLIEYAVEKGQSRQYTEAAEEKWAGLKPDRNYKCAVLSEDYSGDTHLEYVDFVTAVSTGREPQLEVTLEKSAIKPHEELELNVSCDIAYIGRYLVMPFTELGYLLGSGATEEKLISELGTDFNIDQIEEINSPGGLTLTIGDLYPTEYACIVAIRSLEEVETYKQAKAALDYWPAETKVQSDLFTALQGKWKLSYSYLDYNGTEQQFTDVEVTISDGADDRTRQLYTDRNVLVLTGYPFQQGDYPYYSPDDLRAANQKYALCDDLASRDYGSKIFLHIGAGDVVTVPTASNVYLLNWTDDNIPLNFWGMDYEKKQIAPAHFPVEVSDDRKTITIKELVSGPEFENGVYRPSVMENGAMRCVATSDIVLRKAE